MSNDQDNEPAVKVEPDEWMEGWRSGALGHPYESGHSLSFLSGRVEGTAEREASLAEGRPLRLPQKRPMPKDQ